MNDLAFAVELTITGVLIGLLYSMIALGFVLIFKASSVFNFAQGAMTLFSALTLVGLIPLVGFWLALVGAVLIMCVVALVAERVAFRPLIGSSPLVIFMATIGLAYILEGFAQMVWGTQPHGLKLGLPVDPLKLGSIFISKSDLISAGVAGVLVALLIVFFQYTKIGLGLRAIANDQIAAQSVGIDLRKVWAIAWILAGFVALVAGMLWGSRIGVHFAMSLIALKALPVLIIGGIESIPGAIVGGIIVGVAEALGEGFIGPYVGGGVQDVMAYLVALIFLLIRPYGIFGQAAIERV
ncbi:MAG: branched-chain amino acid ABC transporter permease [Pirellulales bacterium]|jgi:branched-chain amino acid transport system permease protein|nr:branched-chain amino acid ABC transporter permease [Pirellulales bacterium]